MKKIIAVFFVFFPISLLAEENGGSKTKTAEPLREYKQEAYVACKDFSRANEQLIGCQLYGARPKEIEWATEGELKPKGYGWFYYILVSSRPKTTKVRFIDPKDPYHRVQVINIVYQKIGESFACLSCIEINLDDLKAPSKQALPQETIASSSPP